MLKKKKNVVGIFLLTFIMIFTTFTSLINGPVALAESEVMVRSEGFLTSYESATKECPLDDDELSLDFDPTEIESIDDSSVSGFTISVVDMVRSLINFVVGAVVSFLYDAAEAVIKIVCKTADAVDAEKRDSLGIMSIFMIFGKLANLTNVKSLMGLTGLIQNIALILMILYLLYFGYQVMAQKGEYRSSKEMFSYIFRFSLVMVIIAKAPELLQDILNLNNTLSHYLSQMTITINSEFATGEGEITGPVEYSILFSFLSLLTNASEYLDIAITASPGMATIMMLVILIILILVLLPTFRIVVWWYTRYFKLFIYTIISSIMLMTLASPSTEGTGRNFIMNFIRTVFEQFFVLLGLATIATFLGEITVIAKDLGLGFIGKGIAYYAVLSFIAQIPTLAAGMLEGGSPVRDSGLGGSRVLNRGMNFAKSGIRSFVGGGLGGYAGAKAAMNTNNTNQTNNKKPTNSFDTMSQVAQNRNAPHRKNETGLNDMAKNPNTNVDDFWNRAKGSFEKGEDPPKKD